MAQSQASRQSVSLWTNRNYVLLLAGQSFSLIGDWFFLATISLWIIDRLARGQSWLPLAVGAVPLIVAFPSLILGPLAGVFVDRWERRKTMLLTDLLRCGLVLLFAIAILFISAPAWLLVGCYCILLLCACGSQFFDPAQVAVMNDCILPEQRPMAFGSLKQARYLAIIIGPTLAAPLYVALGPYWAFGLNAASYGISFLVLLFVSAPQYSKGQEKQAGFWREFVEGLQFFLRNRILVTLLTTGMLFMFASMAYNTFEFLYGVENLHISNGLLGLYVACNGLGVVIGLPFAAFLARRLGEVQLLWMFLIGNGLSLAALSRVNTMLPGMVCIFLMGIFNTAIFVTVRPLTIRVTPAEFIGRVMAFETPMITVASLLGGTLAGILASTVLLHFHATFAGFTFQRLDTIFALASLIIIGAGIFARLTLYREVKKLNARETAAKEQLSSNPAPDNISVAQHPVAQKEEGDYITD
ncbi:MFS transporter [Ktedonosporobacter rubrisoli]|uniref:MFS transporter n=1 Tax=Ktedonosporobacter rubrisoli TaxID=2509675 RepID=A0A4P6JHX1_KTERU|nr:MFS transporter [Ktedonosporobacter rubrisoli]QBD74639.1 MFS transporter [Ktedonosporobacter rubrisoli]